VAETTCAFCASSGLRFGAIFQKIYPTRIVLERAFGHRRRQVSRKILLLENELPDSHYLPRALCRSSRATVDGKAVGPVMMNPDVTMYEAEQVKTYLLCSDCEQRFSSLGETWAGACSLQSDGNFPLRDLLLQQPMVPAPGAENPWYCGAISPASRAREI
jgi:hypothetical protein